MTNTNFTKNAEGIVQERNDRYAKIFQPLTDVYKRQQSSGAGGETGERSRYGRKKRFKRLADGDD